MSEYTKSICRVPQFLFVFIVPVERIELSRPGGLRILNLVAILYRLVLRIISLFSVFRILLPSKHVYKYYHFLLGRSI
jgi:hypothetical protein